MLKTFAIGILLGVVAAAALLRVYPLVDQVREPSIVSVAANGGNVESFHIKVPMDRIMVGAPDRDPPLPAGLEWPSDPLLDDVRIELFKIRNARDTVVGVAARTAASGGPTQVIDWVLHLPARGSVYVNMSPDPVEGGFRVGDLSAGSREFSLLGGSMTEHWQPDRSGDEDAPTGRIELVTKFVGELEAL